MGSAHTGALAAAAANKILLEEGTQREKAAAAVIVASVEVTWFTFFAVDTCHTSRTKAFGRQKK